MNATRRNNGELYAQALDATRPYIAAVRDDQWSLQTPCTEWDLRRLVNHVLSGTFWVEDIFKGKTVAEVGDKYDGDLIGENALAAYDSAVASAKAAVLQPGAMDQVCHLRRGDTSGADYCRSMFVDVLIHGWDIGKALGGDPKLVPELVEACYEFVKDRKEQPRMGSAFAAPIGLSGVRGPPDPGAGDSWTKGVNSSDAGGTDWPATIPFWSDVADWLFCCPEEASMTPSGPR